MQPRHSILLIDDYAELGNVFRWIFKDEYTVDMATDFKGGLAIARQGQHQALIVDLMLDGNPRFGGLELIDTLRKENDKRPILAISGMPDRDLQVRAIETGAQYFLPKTSLNENFRSVMAGLIRDHGNALSEDNSASTIRLPGGTSLPKKTFTFAGATIDPMLTTIVVGDKTEKATQQEISLLYQLYVHRGRTATRADLWVLAWGGSAIGSSNSIDMHMSRIRTRYKNLGLSLDNFVAAVPKIGWHIAAQ